MVSQLQVLCKVLETGDYSLISLNNLTVDYFFDYKAEFNFIKTHYATYHKVPDKLTFTATFPDFNYVKVTEPDNFLLTQLYNDYNTSYVVELFNDVKARIEDNKTAGLVNHIKQSIEGLHTGGAMTCTNLWKDTRRYDHYVERQTHGYYKTGFEPLDRVLGGIDPENENMVIAARPGLGKTYILLTIGVNLAKQGLNVGLYEGEMTADKVGYRIDTIRGHISNTDLNRGNQYSRKQYESYLEEIVNDTSYGDLKVLTQSDVGGPVTVDVLRAFVEREHLDVLLVDQYSLLEDTSRAKASWERVGSIAKAIKQLQVEKQIPIISVSQQNRTKPEDGTPDTSQVGLSDMIPQYATVLLSLERDKNDANKITISITKARDGGNGNSFTYHIDWDTGIFRYIPDEKDGAATQEDTDAIKNRYSTNEGTTSI